MKRTTKSRKSGLTPRRRRPRGPTKRIDPRLKSQLDTYDLHKRWGLTQAQILQLADGDNPVIRGNWGQNGRLSIPWTEIFRVEGSLQQGRPLTEIERRQAMANPLTPKQYANHPYKYGPAISEDSVRKAIREGRQVGVFRLGTRIYLRAAAVVKLTV